MHVADPRFAPLLTGHPVKAPATSFVEACRAASSRRLGAADVLYARHTGTVDLAIILEPDVTRRRALEMLPLFVLAAVEGVGALMPPKTSVLWRWPDRLLVNGAVAGRFSFAMATSTLDEVPDWLVVAAKIDLSPRPGASEPGFDPHRTSLYAEGAGETTRSEFLEVIAAYTLTWINTWSEGGFAPVHEALVGRIEGHGEPADIAIGPDDLGGAHLSASVLGIDEEMRLIVKVGEGDVRALAIEDRLAATEGAGERLE